MMFKAFICTTLVIAVVQCEPPAPQYGVPFNNNNNVGGYNNGGYNNGGYNGGNDGNGHGSQGVNGNVPINSYGTPNYDSQHDHHEYGEPKAYEFGYQVKDDYTGTNYNRQEQSDGNQVTGSYRVALPDGRTQIVTYYADWKTGFHADVRYEGEAQYPEQYNTGNGGYGNNNNYNNNNNNYNNNGPSNQYGPPVNPVAINNGYSGSNYPASSSVSINNGQNYDSGYNNGNYDTYANSGFGNKAKPSTAYGAP